MVLQEREADRKSPTGMATVSTGSSTRTGALVASLEQESVMDRNFQEGIYDSVHLPQKVSIGK